MSQPTVGSRGDRAGIVLASLCFVHCVAGPALLAFGGLASLINVSEKFEPAFLLGSAVMGAFALFPAYRKRHGRLSCLAIFASALLVLLLRRPLGAGAGVLEPAITLVGAAMIVAAHVLNLKYSRRCHCCEEATPSVDRKAG